MDIRAITFDDILLRPQYSKIQSRAEVSTSVTDKTGKLSLALPIISANMDTVTEHEMANWIHSQGGLGALHRFMSVEANLKEYKASPKETIVSVGTNPKEMERAEALVNAGATNICVDVAHGHAEYVKTMIKALRDKFGSSICIIAGNVATKEGAQFLADAGADIIKVGIGGGSVCTTRIKTGFGVPTLASIIECANVDRSLIADGGIRTPGDIVKALACGADFVMLGSMLSGTHYTPGLITGQEPNYGYKDEEGSHGRSHAVSVITGYDYSKARKSYRGMSSKDVADQHLGGLTWQRTDEGVSTTVPYKDKEKSEYIIQDIRGGLRSGLTYSGVNNIVDLQKYVNYHLISEASKTESLPHKLLGS